MLILTRVQGQQLRIGEDICLKVLQVRGKNVSIGIAAPESIVIFREEIFQRIQRQAEIQKEYYLGEGK
jgi:carbon storage regulator